ncbi:hypothetical protein [Planococcus shenhongbingii]|uniref:HEAT repeat domain-containing protein n=1 Tax=Planococcus shenhongbingii TaxID=3058398 RepID=A0ABT8NCT9_9BACL|nr:hypothetical protein [Planococcus sp. N017]MDN7245673.1 hypothetical protein [Planococcus sp. N017]
MEQQIQRYFDGLESPDKQIQYESFTSIMAITEKEVDWAYEIWDELLKGLTDPNNHTRSRAAQFLSQLAISDPENRILDDFPALWEVTKDPKFVTARHALQAVWRVGLAGDEQQGLVVDHLADRFKNCTAEKNHTLIRFDIIQGLRKLFDETKEMKIKQIALDLIGLEEDSKYEKKYKAVWKNV